MTKQFICHSIVCLSIVALYSSCTTYNCGEALGMTISTVAITAAERDTIILRKFVKGSAFTKMEDSVFVQPRYEVTNDTAAAVAFSSNEALTSQYDYEIYFPAIKKLVRITDINEPQQKMKQWFWSTDKTACGNVIQSYNQDGKIVTNEYYLYNRVYIHR